MDALPFIFPKPRSCHTGFGWIALVWCWAFPTSYPFECDSPSLIPSLALSGWMSFNKHTFAGADPHAHYYFHPTKNQPVSLGQFWQETARLFLTTVVYVPCGQDLIFHFREGSQQHFLLPIKAGFNFPLPILMVVVSGGTVLSDQGPPLTFLLVSVLFELLPSFYLHVHLVFVIFCHTSGSLLLFPFFVRRILLFYRGHCWLASQRDAHSDGPGVLWRHPKPLWLWAQTISF